MPVFSRNRSAIGPASLGPHPGQIGAVYWTSGRRSTRGAGGNRDVQRRSKQMRQERIEEEVSELLVILRIIHTESVFKSGADDQLVNQGVALAVRHSALEVK